MNTRQTTRIRDDPAMALRSRDVNGEEYDPHWRDRQLPGNQEIYDRGSREESRRRHEERDKQVTAAGRPQPMRTLTHCIDEIHDRGGDAVRLRQLADSPISHHNT